MRRGGEPAGPAAADLDAAGLVAMRDRRDHVDDVPAGGDRQREAELVAVLLHGAAGPSRAELDLAVDEDVRALQSTAFGSLASAVSRCSDAGRPRELVDGGLDVAAVLGRGREREVRLVALERVGKSWSRRWTSAML